MPQRAWSAKRERQYGHIKDSLMERGKAEPLAEEIAARVVNKERAQHGESVQASASSINDMSASRRGGLRSHQGAGGRPRTAMVNVSITGLRSELGGVVVQQPVSAAVAGVHINLVGQRANTLLHDGHAWKDFASTARAGVRRAMRAAEAGGAPLLVHASFAFVQAVEQGARLSQPLRSAVDAILECEAMALSGPVPACVVRLGYLYGPASADLRAYRGAFRLGRPYWSGSAKALQYHVHQLDAGAALLGAARLRNAGKVMYATDGTAVSFRELMDAFAQRVGRPSPLHLPAWSKRLAELVIREEHMQQVALNMPHRSPVPRVPGWRPKFADYRKGLDQVQLAWAP